MASSNLYGRFSEHKYLSPLLEILQLVHVNFFFFKNICQVTTILQASDTNLSYAL